jgi:archaellum component FlaF (FlaF/FlaG flagellin family)
VVSRAALVLIVGVLLIASVSGAVLVTIPLTARTQTQTVTIQALPITTTATNYVSVPFTVNVTVTANATSEELLILKKYKWDVFNVTGATSAINLITLDFQNVGSVPINLAQSNVSIGGVPVPQPSGACGILLTPGSTCIYSFTLPNGNWVAGTVYTLEFVTPDGKVFSYSIVAGGG